MVKSQAWEVFKTWLNKSPFVCPALPPVLSEEVHGIGWPPTVCSNQSILFVLPFFFKGNIPTGVSIGHDHFEGYLKFLIQPGMWRTKGAASTVKAVHGTRELHTTSPQLQNWLSSSRFMKRYLVGERQLTENLKWHFWKFAQQNTAANLIVSKVISSNTRKAKSWDLTSSSVTLVVCA